MIAKLFKYHNKSHEMTTPTGNKRPFEKPNKG